MKIIYLGPSGHNIERGSELLEDWLVKPPCQQADIINDIENFNPEKICIVDGLYKTIPAPWHKEILIAIENGIRVDGVGSLGALRAAELDEYGMSGYGWIYDFIKKNEPVDDSLVALLHMDEMNDFKPITYAKIEIIYIFIAQYLKTESNDDQKINGLINEIMNISFERMSKKTAQKFLSNYDPNIDWITLLNSNNYSIKNQDTIDYLKQERVKIFSQKDLARKEIKTELTNYIYRQRHLDLKSGKSGDVSDLGYTIQLYASYNFSETYDNYALQAQLTLLMRLINSIIENRADKLIDKNIKGLCQEYQNRGWKTDGIGLKVVNLEWHNNLPQLIVSQFNNGILNLKSNEWILYHNVYASLEIYGKLKSISNASESMSRETFIACILLTDMYLYLEQGHSYLNKDESSIQTLNEKFAIICNIHHQFLELTKCSSLVGYHAGYTIQRQLLEEQKIMNEYNKRIKIKGNNKPFALYSDTYYNSKRSLILKKIQKQNSQRIFEVKPIHSIGTHFYNFHHWLLLLEEIGDE